MARRWSVRDVEVGFRRQNDRVRYVRFPGGFVLGVRAETAATMVIDTIDELRTRSTRRAELRLAFLRRLYTAGEWRTVEAVFLDGAGEIRPMPATVDELLAALGGVDG